LGRDDSFANAAFNYLAFCSPKIAVVNGQLVETYTYGPNGLVNTTNTATSNTAVTLVTYSDSGHFSGMTQTYLRGGKGL